MPYNFDQPTDRKNNNSIKWSKFPDDVLPLWVADMDFESPVEVKEALQNLVGHKIYGYAGAPAELFDVIIERLEKNINGRSRRNGLFFYQV